jgi:hypothetical protein
MGWDPASSETLVSPSQLPMSCPLRAVWAQYDASGQSFQALFGPGHVIIRVRIRVRVYVNVFFSFSLSLVIHLCRNLKEISSYDLLLAYNQTIDVIRVALAVYFYVSVL